MARLARPQARTRKGLTVATRTFDRSRLRLGIVIAIIAGALVLLLIQVGKATVFDRDADWVVTHRESVGTKTFRLQGIVRPDSVHDVGKSEIAFEVEYNCVVIPVRHHGGQPALFKPGIPVVLEGSFPSKTAKTFESNKILVRHTAEYRTKASEKAEATEKERCSS